MAKLNTNINLDGIDLNNITEEQIMQLDEDTMRYLFENMQELQEKGKVKGPQTDDELHQWFIDELNIDIPRVAVCEGHDAPFSFLADVYFGREKNALVMASRAGMKTLSVAMLHYANGENKPEYDGLTFGAIQAQSDRCYEHLEKWVKQRSANGDLKERDNIRNSTITETNWKNGSKVEIVPGTKSAVNGPHPQVAHADEAELMKQDAWEESRNMAASKVSANGIVMPAQNIITSTRKSANGRMQQLINEVNDAKEKGYKPPFRLYVWCIKEVTAQVVNCRMAPENEGKDDSEVCDCHLVPKGKFSDGTDRTLDKICNGDFYKSRGNKPLDEVQTIFSQNIPAVWDAQQECKKPSTENNYIPEWDETHHIIKEYHPSPFNGPIFTATDWGAGNPNGVLWIQKLVKDVECQSFHDEPKILHAGTYVIFDELYVAQIGAGKLAKKVKQKERIYKQRYGQQWKVKGRFADPQGLQQRHDWMDEGLKTTWHITRDFEYQLLAVQEKFIDDEAFVTEQCKFFKEEIEVWRKDDKGKQVDEFNHLMSALRYGFTNMNAVTKGDTGSGQGVVRKAKNAARRKLSYRKKGPIGTMGKSEPMLQRA